MKLNFRGFPNKLKPCLKIQKLTIIVATMVLVLLILFAGLFGQAYHKLSASIQQERLDYVSEISDQIINSQQFMKNEYSNLIQDYAQILNNSEVATLSKLSPYLDKQELLLISTAGNIVDLKGQRVILTDRLLINNLTKSSGVIQSFASLNYIQDYWLFATALEPLEFDGATYITIVLAIPADEFQANLAISLFDQRGASYIIQPNGSIEIKPKESKISFQGFNLFISMLQAGAAEKEIAVLEKEIAANPSGSQLLTIKQEQWLISYSKLEGQNEILVVTVPLTITAAQTYDGLTNTIVYAVLVVLTMALIVILLLLFFFHRDREQSRKAMAVAAKSDFFSKMSHDIRTPLNAIIGLEMMARDSIQEPEIAANYLAQSSSAADYLLSIINDVLDMSRIESGKLVIAKNPFDFNELLEEISNIITAMALEKKLHFTWEVQPKFTANYIGDQIRLKQILMNLLSNSVKFTPEQGKITLRVTYQPQDEQQDLVTLVVSDSGVGMSEAYLERIFTPFEQERSSYTEQSKGSGLGLSIVHNLVSLMGGSIEVESRQGQGSSFTLQLPFKKSESPLENSPAPIKTDISLAGKRVLLAEDNLVNQQVALAILNKKLGMIVEISGDGQQAVNKFAVSSPGHYQVILMDVKMPIMDGLEASRQIRQLDHPEAKTIPIIALSANAFAEDVQLSLESGMNAHLSKPIDLKALASILAKYLNDRNS